MNLRRFINLKHSAVPLALIGVVIFGLIGIRVEKYNDSKVTGGEIIRMLDFIAVHSSRSKYLIVNGQVYHDVRGTPPYYLDVPALNSILFVTGKIGDRTLFHLVNISTKEHVEINGGTSAFGGQIGGPRKAGEAFTDYIELVNSNRIVLVKRTSAWTKKTTLNLEKKTID